jgi:hypothetical protein
MNMNPSSSPVVVARPFWKRHVFVVAAIVLGTAGITAAASVWWVKHNFYASTLHPVALNAGEKAELDSKLTAMSAAGQAEAPALPASDPRKTLELSEREINAFLADQGLGEQVKVELGNGTGTATAIVPIEKEAPMFGGKTLRIQCAFNARMDDHNKLAFSITDLSVGGISLPNAWLGNLKGMNLFQNADVSNDPAVQGFLAGVKDFAISGGALRVVLND